METKLIIGASAYCHIRTASVSMDVRLEPGRSAAQSLAETADELRVKAGKMLARADLIDRAAAQLGR